MTSLFSPAFTPNALLPLEFSPATLSLSSHYVTDAQLKSFELDPPAIDSHCHNPSASPKREQIESEGLDVTLDQTASLSPSSSSSSLSVSSVSPLHDSAISDGLCSVCHCCTVARRLTNTVATLKQKISATSSLVVLYQNTQTALDNTQSQLQSLQSSHSALTLVHRTLAERESQSRSQMTALEAQVRELTADKLKCDRIIAAHNSHIGQLRATISALTHEKEETMAKEGRKRDADKQVDAWKKKCDDLRDQLAWLKKESEMREYGLRKEIEAGNTAHTPQTVSGDVTLLSETGGGSKAEIVIDVDRLEDSQPQPQRQALSLTAAAAQPSNAMVSCTSPQLTSSILASATRQSLSIARKAILQLRAALSKKNAIIDELKSKTKSKSSQSESAPYGFRKKRRRGSFVDADDDAGLAAFADDVAEAFSELREESIEPEPQPEFSDFIEVDDTARVDAVTQHLIQPAIKRARDRSRLNPVPEMHDEDESIPVIPSQLPSKTQPRRSIRKRKWQESEVAAPVPVASPARTTVSEAAPTPPVNRGRPPRKCVLASAVFVDPVPVAVPVAAEEEEQAMNHTSITSQSIVSSALSPPESLQADSPPPLESPALDAAPTPATLPPPIPRVPKSHKWQPKAKSKTTLWARKQEINVNFRAAVEACCREPGAADSDSSSYEKCVEELQSIVCACSSAAKASNALCDGRLHWPTAHSHLLTTLDTLASSADASPFKDMEQCALACAEVMQQLDTALQAREPRPDTSFLVAFADRLSHHIIDTLPQLTPLSALTFLHLSQLTGKENQLRNVVVQSLLAGCAHLGVLEAIVRVQPAVVDDGSHSLLTRTIKLVLALITRNTESEQYPTLHSLIASESSLLASMGARYMSHRLIQEFITLATTAPPSACAVDGELRLSARLAFTALGFPLSYCLIRRDILMALDQCTNEVAVARVIDIVTAGVEVGLRLTHGHSPSASAEQSSTLSVREPLLALLHYLHSFRVDGLSHAVQCYAMSRVLELTQLAPASFLPHNELSSLKQTLSEWRQAWTDDEREAFDTDTSRLLAHCAPLNELA